MAIYGTGGQFGGGMMNPNYGRQYGFGQGTWGSWSPTSPNQWGDPGPFGGEYNPDTGRWTQNAGNTTPTWGEQMDAVRHAQNAANQQEGWDKARGDAGAWLGGNMIGILDDWRKGKFGPKLTQWGSGGPGGAAGRSGFGGGMWPGASGEGGAGGAGGWTPTEWTGGQSNIDVIDPRAYIEANKAPINRQLEASMAEAAARAGATGAMIGKPYQDALGEAAGNAAEDIAALTQGSWLDASKFNASNQLAAQQADLDRQMQAWAQTNDWGYGANQAGLDRSLSAWEGNQNRDLDAWAQWNNWQMQSSQLNNPFMSQLFGLMQQG